MGEIFNSFSLDDFHFESNAYLYLIILVFAFGLFEFYPGRRFNFSISKLKKFIDEDLIPHLLQGSENKTKNIFKAFYILVICLLLVVALANPRWNFIQVESYKANVNVIFAIDLSKSMDAEDEKPSRIDRVKQEINDIVSSLDGVNFGLLGFANHSHIISPITSDKSSIEYFVDTISTDLISVQGSNIDVAIRQANLMFKSVAGGINYLIIMSDGDFDTNQNMASFRLGLENAKLISYGFGTSEGAPIKRKDGGFLKHQDRIVISKYNADNLRNLSGNDGYVKSSYLDDDVAYIKAKIDEKKLAETSKYQTMQIWHDRFYILLIIAMVMLLPFFRAGSVFPVITVLLTSGSLLFAGPMAGYAKGEESAKKESEIDLEFLKFENIKNNILSADLFRNDDQKAVIDFEERNYEDAIEKFSSVYNKSVAAYRGKDYSASEEYILQLDNPNIEEMYNLGNAQIMQMKIEEAIASYEEVLKRDEEHADAKHNLEIAKKILEQREKNNKDNKSDKSQKGKNGKDSKGRGQSSNADGDNSKGDSSSGQNRDKNRDGSSQGESNSSESERDQNGDSSNDSQNNGSNSNLNDNNFRNEDNSNKGGDAKGDSIDLNTGGGNAEQNSSKEARKELNRKADKLFEKLSADTEKFMKNRFRYQERKELINKQGDSKDIKPW